MSWEVPSQQGVGEHLDGDLDAISFFQKTGSPTRLSVAQAHEMQLSSDLMHTVPGATEDDIALASTRDLEMQKQAVDHMREIESAFGIDPCQLENIFQEQGFPAVARKLLDVACTRITDSHSENLEYAIRKSEEILRDSILQRTGSVDEILQSLSIERNVSFFADLRSVGRVFEEIRHMAHPDDDISSPQRTLAMKAQEEIHGGLEKILRSHYASDSNAMMLLRGRSFATDHLNRMHEGYLDIENSAPYVFAPRQLAVGSHDENRIYIYNNSKDGEDDIDALHEKSGGDDLTGRVLRRDLRDVTAYELAISADLVKMEELGYRIKERDHLIEDYLPGHASPEEVEEFIAFSQNGVRVPVQEEWGINVTELTITEQWHFFHYLKDNTVGDFEKTTAFYEKYEKEGLRTFLSLEHGGQSMGEKIISIGEKYSESGVAKKVFAKYGEIVDASNAAHALLEQQFQDASPRQITQIRESLLLRGKKVLELAAQEDISADALMQKLDSIHGEIESMKALYRMGCAEGTITKIEDVMSLSPRTLSGEIFLQNETLTQQARAILEKEHGIGSEKSQMLLREFTASLHKTDASVRMIMHDTQELVAFIFSYTQDDGAVHVGGLNVDTSVRDMALGPYLAHATIERLSSEGRDIAVESTPRNARAYIKKYGFTIQGSEQFSDAHYYRLHRSPSPEQRSTDLTVAEIRNLSRDSSQDIYSVVHESDEWTPDHLGDRVEIAQTYRDKKEGLTYYVIRSLDSN